MKVRPRPAIALAGVVFVGAAVGAALVLRPGSGTPASATPVPAVAPPAHFPAPPDGAVVCSRRLGSDALALGVVPRRASVLVQASVVGPQGRGVSGLSVAFVVQGATKSATACGAGCYRATLITKGRPTSVDVVLNGANSTHWRVALPATWPPPDADEQRVRCGARFARSASPKASRLDPVTSR